MMTTKHRMTPAVVCAATLLFGGFPEQYVRGADDVWPRSRAVYGSLGSYADTGVILKEYGTSSQDRHTFTTYFNRAPRGFYFEFNNQGGDRYVIWADPDAFHSWWKGTGQKSDYPNPNNVPALNLAGPQTASASSKIPSLLYANAPILSDFANFTDVKTTGPEEVGGRPCYRITGKASASYVASGREVDVRQMTVWVDAESLLIRKLVEERKPLPGQIDRLTTTFEPQANPKIAEVRFRFTPPGSM